MSLRNLQRSLFTSIASGALLLGLGSGPAFADEIAPLFEDGFNDLSDDSAEELINLVGPDDGTIDVGDVLSGISSINTINGEIIGGTSDFNELTAYFQIQVESITPANGGSCAQAPGDVCYTFVPYLGFQTELETTFGVTDATGAMAIFFEDPANDFVRDTDTATGYASATGGDKYWLFGFGDSDDYWTAVAAGNDIDIAESFPPTTPFGDFQVALSLLANWSPLQFGPLTCTVQGQDGAVLVTTNDVCGTGNLLGISGENTGFDSYDDVNFRINVVPEPATLGLFGLGLLGLALVNRRRRLIA